MPNSKEKRGFYGSSFVFLTICAILTTLFFVEIPESNNDVVKVMIGMIVSALSMILYTIAGRNPDEVDALKNENIRVKEENTNLRERLDKLESMFMDFQKTELEHHKQMIEKFENVFSKQLKNEN